MSFVSGLKKTPLAQIPARLEIYEKFITEAEALFELRGRGLEDANKEHAQNLVAYDLMLQEAKTIEDYLRCKLEEIEATTYRKYVETSLRALTATDLKMYVRSDPDYVEANQILLDIAHTRKQLESIVGALTTLGWSLNNIVKLRVAQMDHIVL